MRGKVVAREGPRRAWAAPDSEEDAPHVPRVYRDLSVNEIRKRLSELLPRDG